MHDASIVCDIAGFGEFGDLGLMSTNFIDQTNVINHYTTPQTSYA